MRLYFSKIYFIVPLLFLSSTVFSSDDTIFPSKTVYFGFNLGGGSTEWKYLVDTTDPNDPSTTTPSSVSEGGPSWGAVFGYDLSKNFAIEFQYMQFADAHINLSPSGPYWDANGNIITSIISRTNAYSISGKFLVPVGKTHFRAFAAIGAGIVERIDPLVNYQVNPNAPPGPESNYTGTDHTISCVTPYLSSGLVYSFTRHWMIEGGFQYYTGFGRSELDPVSSFIPFAWDAYGRLAYQL